MSDDKLICPLMKDECFEGKCGWYVNGLNQCAMNTIAQAIDCLDDFFEDQRND